MITGSQPPAAACAAALIIAAAASVSLGISATKLQVLVLEAAMPSTMLTVVIASSDGYDARLTSRLGFATGL